MQKLGHVRSGAPDGEDQENEEWLDDLDGDNATNEYEHPRPQRGYVLTRNHSGNLHQSFRGNFPSL